MTSLLASVLAAGSQAVLVVGTLADPSSLAPHRASDLVSAAIVGNVCDTLVRQRAGSRPEAALATSWATADGRSWTFTLREGVRFHDGAPFDADAVLANVEHLRRSWGFAARAQRLGPHAVTFVLEKPNAALLATLSQPFFALQSPRALDGDRPVGTGPFRLASAGRGVVELRANPAYWAGAPRLESLVFRRYPSEDALLAALHAGEVDVTAALGQDRVAELRGDRSLTLDSKTGLNLVYLALNNARPPFDDARVRRAITRALDRRALVDAILGGHGEPARNPLPPSLWGYASETAPLRRDRTAARRLLAEAGHPNGLAVKLMTADTPRPYLHEPRRLASLLQAQLAEVGIRLQVEPVSAWTDYVARGARGDYDLAVFGWHADSTDPNDFLAALLGSESIGSSNRSRYASAAMDALLKRGRLGGGPQERLQAYREAQALFQEDMPLAPLYHVSVFTAHRRVVQGLTLGPTGILRYDKAWKTE